MWVSALSDKHQIDPPRESPRLEYSHWDLASGIVPRSGLSFVHSRCVSDDDRSRAGLNLWNPFII
jgi:hypothetical protein